MSLKYGARLLTLNKFQKLSSWSDRSQNHCSSSRYLLFHTSTMASGGDVKTSSNPNRLIESKSPYLLQHAYNPVDWFPWGEEAFAKAREEQKLVFLSVGYSTCHWCHVMEKESFENKDIAKIMNNDFVCIKVDREERPDVDKIYMTFIQAISGRGGWPMSVFMTPELHPVFGGTYYPPDDRYYGQPGFGTLLKSLAEQWKENPAKFRASGDKILSILKSSASVGMASLAAVPDAVACATRCFGQLRTSYEPKFGGFSERPKFPQPVNLGFLLRWHVRQSGSQDDASAQQALDMVVHTLRMMAKGGIFDHISLGFARYSTDDQWHVPHFEKMLYDQAQLVSVYTDAYLVTGEKDFARVAHDVLDYVERCLTDPSGGFYSAEDADSYPDADAKAKREGAFCVWTRDEIQSLLGGSLTVEGSVTLADLVCHHFDIRPEGNVDPYQDPHDELKGKNVPIIRGSEQATAAKLGLSLAVFRESLKSALSVMRKARLLRPPPHLDDKMLAAWNGLMISAFAKAGAAFLKDAVDDVEEAEKKSVCYVQRAIKAAAFLRQHLFDPASGRLIRSCYRSNALDDATRAEPGDTVSQNAVPIFGFLDDYAFVIRGLLDLYASCQDQEWLQWADQLQQKQDELFWDTDSGGYFTSAVGDVSILVRLKEDQDGAEPSGNSVSAGNLVRLAVLVDRIEYEEKAGRLLRLFSERLAKVPISLPEMLSALVLYNDSPSEVLIVGPSGDKSAERLFRESLLHKQSVLGQLVVRLDDSSLSNSFLTERRPSLEAMTSRHGKLVSGAYLCRNRSCSSTPITSVQDLRDILDQNHQPHTTA